MEFNLSPKNPKKTYSGDGRSYLSWSPNDLPKLLAGNIYAVKLELAECGLALPTYSDSAKVPYVLEAPTEFVFMKSPHISPEENITRGRSTKARVPPERKRNVAGDEGEDGRS